MNEKQLYDMVRNYAKSQMKKSKTVASHYDWEDIAQKVFLRYHKCGYKAKHPATYMYMMVRSEICNQYKMDKLRSYKERPQHKVKVDSENASVWFSEEEDTWNDSFICAGPEEILDLRDRLKWVESKAKYEDCIDNEVIFDLALGETKKTVVNNSGYSRNKFYGDMAKFKRRYDKEFVDTQ